MERQTTLVDRPINFARPTYFFVGTHSLAVFLPLIGIICWLMELAL